VARAAAVGESAFQHARHHGAVSLQTVQAAATHVHSATRYADSCRIHRCRIAEPRLRGGHDYPPGPAAGAVVQFGESTLGEAGEQMGSSGLIARYAPPSGMRRHQPAADTGRILRVHKPSRCLRRRCRSPQAQALARQSPSAGAEPDHQRKPSLQNPYELSGWRQSEVEVLLLKRRTTRGKEKSNKGLESLRR